MLQKRRAINNKKTEDFFSLIRLGIGHSAFYRFDNIDWNGIEVLADNHGLSAIIVDGVEKLPEKNRPPQAILLQWIGNTIQGYEYRYELYRQAIAEIAAWHNDNGFKMMVLKGYACGVDWPKPEHRPCGDIDIWQFGMQKEADDALRKQGVVIDKTHHHHTVFEWKGFTVENHYDFVNVYTRKSSKELEEVFKDLGNDDSHFVELYGERVYIPSPNLHALFLIRHMVSHFAAAEITLRQVLDWAFFVEKHTKELDWEWLEGMLVKYHMKEFVSCINVICVEDLGFSVGIFPTVQFVPELKERVLEDILDPEYTAAEPEGFFPRVIYKYKRWQGNAWKQEMCYAESRWSAFWSGIWAKILKPASI